MDNQLFALALGISEPLYIEKVEFKDEKLHMYIAFRKGTKFTCSSCGAENQPVHDTVGKLHKWLHRDV
jgi:hypothetical protein